MAITSQSGYEPPVLSITMSCYLNREATRITKLYLKHMDGHEHLPIHTQFFNSCKYLHTYVNLVYEHLHILYIGTCSSLVCATYIRSVTIV